MKINKEGTISKHKSSKVRKWEEMKVGLEKEERKAGSEGRRGGGMVVRKERKKDMEGENALTIEREKLPIVKRKH